MKRVFILWIFIALWTQLNASGTLVDFLQGLPVSEIRVLETEFVYEEILEVMIEQPLDHRNPDGPKFMQRLYISNLDPEKPVVLVTEGYSAKYYYNSEIALEFHCNQIMVEHRYFGRSVPDSLDWNYLDTWQAASDIHRIVETFRHFYPGKWISTGISKGGQTVMYHSFYYPEDINVCVPYVAPLNYSVEDTRIYDFLDNVGKRKDRKKIYRFQKMMLKNQETYLPAFRDLSDKKGYTYDYVGGYEKAFEYAVLEYSFAFWQWGYVPVSKIPGRGASPAGAVEHMNKVAEFDYFSDQFITEYQPFFYQALTEMGYYGYDLKEFEGLLQHVTNPIFTFTIPEDVEIEFDNNLWQELNHYIVNDADHFVFIYGQNDTWSATGVFELSPDSNSKVFVQEGGSHRTRINNMPQKVRDEIYRTIRVYLMN
jgi:hypothetical protein